MIPPAKNNINQKQYQPRNTRKKKEQMIFPIKDRIFFLVLSLVRVFRVVRGRKVFG
jgi:hypothetical protein